MNSMVTSRRSNDFWVGITVIVVTVLLIASVLWLKQADLRGGQRQLVVRSREVGGVSPGNPVVIRGVRSGRIESISLGEPGWVVVRLAVDRDVLLPPDPVVLLVASSLFGEWQATITTGAAVPPDQDLRAAIAEARTGSDTLAGAVMPDIAQLTTVAGRLAGDVAKVTERVQVAFDDQAAAELRESIRNFARLSSTLARTIDIQSKNLDRLSSDAHAGLANINAAAERLAAFSARADSATSSGELQQILGNSREAASEMAVAAANFREMSARLDRTEAHLSTVIARADSVFAKANGTTGTLGLMVNDPALYQQSDSLVRELRQLIGDIRRNPRRYLNLRIF